MLKQYEEKLQNGYYYVRTAWEDKDSQVGQYRLLASAIKKADENPGTFIFMGDGIAIYPEADAETTETTPDEAVATVGASGEEEQTNTQPEDENAPEGESEVSSESGEAPSDEDIAEAQTEALGEDEYPNDGNETPVLYAKANTLLNVRAGNSLDADKVTVIKKGTVVEVLQVCDNGWYRIKCEAAECGYAYVSNAIGTYFNTGTSLYTVQPADSLWKIAEKTLNDGKKYTEIKAANNLTSNVIRVGMVLLIP